VRENSKTAKQQNSIWQNCIWQNRQYLALSLTHSFPRFPLASNSTIIKTLHGSNFTNLNTTISVGNSESSVSLDAKDGSLKLNASTSLTDPTSPSSPITPKLSYDITTGDMVARLTKSFVFDRTVTNMLETRAKSIRNSVDLTVEIDKPAGSNQSSSVLGSIYWQLNRAVALKAAVDHESLSYSIFGRNWSPSVFTSLTQKLNFKTGKQTFGLGFEFDSGRPTKSENYLVGERRFAEPETKLVPGRERGGLVREGDGSPEMPEI